MRTTEPRDLGPPSKKYRLDDKIARHNPPDKRYTWKKDELIMYGGKRPDKSKRGDSDTPGSEAGLWSGECEFCMVDYPRTPHATDLGIHELTWDFVGLVFDRCRNWLLVAAKRFVLHRRFEIKLKKNRERATRVVKRGYPKLYGDLPPDSGRSKPKGEPVITDPSCKPC